MIKRDAHPGPSTPLPTVDFCLTKAHTLKCVGCTFNTLTTATPTRLPVQKPSEKPHSTKPVAKPVTKPVAKPVFKPTSKQPHKSNVRV